MAKSVAKVKKEMILARVQNTIEQAQKCYKLRASNALALQM